LLVKILVDGANIDEETPFSLPAGGQEAIFEAVAKKMGISQQITQDKHNDNNSQV